MGMGLFDFGQRPRKGLSTNIRSYAREGIMTRIDIAEIIFDMARGLSEAGYFIQPQWGSVFLVLSMGMATVAIRLIMFRHNRLTARMG